MSEDERKFGEEEEVVSSVEERMKIYVRAREIFNILKGSRRNPPYEYEVSVLGSVTPAHATAAVEKLTGKGYWVGSEGQILTTEDLEYGRGSEAFQFSQALARHFDEGSGAIEHNLSGFEHVITTRTIEGLVPERGDILIEKKHGGFFGSPSKIRLIKIDMGEDQVKVAVDFIIS